MKCQTALGQKEMFILIYSDVLNYYVLVINPAPGVGVTLDAPDTRKRESQEGETEAGQRPDTQLHKPLLWPFIGAVFAHCVLT